ncbi:ABC transporter permease [Thermoflexus sp.]|uniref:ABC transporter permease n=1 Tax=Thermoflexus sp. TaxID=1969742 RepID=UPI0035E42C7D
MDTLLEGLRQAIWLLVHLDATVVEITLRTLQVSGVATLAALVVGVPLGTYLAQARFPGRRLLVSLVNTGMGLPPVVVGLFVALMLWRSGPFGQLGLIYTPAAMVIAQAIIATPIITGVSIAAIQQLDPRLRLQLLGLGASRGQVALIMWWEARRSLLVAAMAGFGGAISEVGASIMVGGNIAGQTRVLTTAAVLEMSKGNFDRAMALGLILLFLSFSITLGATWLQQSERDKR